ncbi:LacI family DNA-binding transcriptional regulator [Lacrimispora sp.]|uniref:LacI family DNA-binding transcriptional regulator n=1 Tax=Lacrimispora sp. TaxID=2719234 RepID=UPI0032E3E1D9
MASIKEIAEMSGVAKSTVSRYLNQGSVSEKTAERIEEVIKKTGYSPNQFAQSLKAKKTKIIGVIIPRLNSNAMSETLLGIDDVLQLNGFQMIISNTNQNIAREIESIYSLAKQKVSGIILAATVITDKHKKAFDEISIPIVVIGQQVPGVPSVIHNDFEAGYCLGNYIFQKGHRFVTYLGIPETDVSVGVKRKQGVIKASKEYKNSVLNIEETSFSSQDAVIMAKKILTGKNQPTAIIAATDNIAVGVLKACYLLGVKVPEQLSIVGVGGDKITDLVYPGITTVKFFFREAGGIAAKSLLKLLEHEKTEEVIVSPYELIDRFSVDKPQ